LNEIDVFEEIITEIENDKQNSNDVA
jgi:hypothetical protein